MHDLVAIQTPQGITWVSREYYVRTLGTNHNLGAVDAFAAGSAIASTGASLVSSFAPQLIAAGLSATAVPVVGQILGGLALIGGMIATSRAKAKAAKDAGAQIDAATVELLQQNTQLDSMLVQAQKALTDVKSEINRLGLAGTSLDGFADWLSKTFTPGKYQANITADKQTNFNNLLAQVEQKIGVLQQMETELKRLYDQLTGGKTLQKVLVIGGSVALGLTALYFLNEKFKWIKF